jgi:hypothetical protein
MKRLFRIPKLNAKAHLASSSFTKAKVTFVVVGLLLMLAAPIVAKVASLKGQLFEDEQTVPGADVYLFAQGTKYRGPVTTEQAGLFAIEAVDDGAYCLVAFVHQDQIGSALINTSDFSSGYKRVDLDHDTDCTNGVARTTISSVGGFTFGTTELAGFLTSLPAPQQGASRDAAPLKDRVLIDAFCGICAIVVIYPILRYLFRHWAFRRDRLFGLLGKGAIVFYYRQFRPGDDPPNVANNASPTTGYMAAFTRDFDRWYGRKYYLAPLLMLSVLTGVATWWGSRSLQNWIIDRSSLDSLRALVASALAGAFVWIISDELDRLRRRDFTVSDVYYYVFRLLLSVPFGWALTRSTVTLQVGIPLAFFLGSFPTTTLFTIARRLGSQQLKLGDDASSGTLELENLQSIGKPNAERFKDEGITTICGLAYADPIDLTIRTNFDFNYVVDCVSQALMWIYFGKDCQALFPLSLRGAQEVSALVTWLDDPRHKESATQTLVDAASRLNVSQGALRTTLCQIAEDPYSKFLVNVWS